MSGIPARPTPRQTMPLCQDDDTFEVSEYDYAYASDLEPCGVCKAAPCRCITVRDERGEVLRGFRF